MEVLPEGAHPFDVRYNMIQWTHRQTRGWSYGGGVADPRTGEMLKANVILGSQRVRQDRMIFEGLAGAGKSGTGSTDDPVEIALSRIRQLSAHEVGHTLGFAHNFAASSNARASVMDYPAPYIRPRANGTLDFSEAYGVGVGDWDVFATKWLYTEFSGGADVEAELDKLVTEAYRSGLRYVADSEARSLGTGHPYGAVWDNGEDAARSLDETLRVRAIALENFGAGVLAEGRPLSDLNAVIVPIYLYHRYQLVAAAKVVGGLEFGYPLRGDASQSVSPVPARAQRRALNAVLKALDPETLDLPDDLLDILSPQINGGFAGGEAFSGNTGPVFDLLGAADVAADITLSALLHPQRMSRLAEFHRRDEDALGMQEMFDAIEETVFAEVEDARLQPIAETIQTRFANTLIALSVDGNASGQVRAAAEARLFSVAARLLSEPTDHATWLAGRIEAHLARGPDETGMAVPTTDIPPGSPIGGGLFGGGPAYETCWHCE